MVFPVLSEVLVVKLRCFGSLWDFPFPKTVTAILQEKGISILADTADANDVRPFLRLPSSDQEAW